MPTDMRRYPKDWKYIRNQILARAKGCCEWCQKPNRVRVKRVAPGGYWQCPYHLVWRNCRGEVVPFERIRKSLGSVEIKEIEVVLTVAHVYDETPANAERWNLAALCQSCHITLDAPRKAARKRGIEVPAPIVPSFWLLRYPPLREATE